MQKKVWAIVVCLAVACANCAFAGEISSRTFSGVRQEQTQNSQKKQQSNNNAPVYNSTSQQSNPTGNGGLSPQSDSVGRQTQKISIEQIRQTADKFMSSVLQAAEQHSFSVLDEFGDIHEIKQDIPVLSSQRFLGYQLMSVCQLRDENFFRAFIWAKSVNTKSYGGPFYTDYLWCIKISAYTPNDVIGVSKTCIFDVLRTCRLAKKILNEDIFNANVKGKYEVMKATDVYSEPNGTVVGKVVTAGGNINSLQILGTKNVGGRLWVFAFIGTDIGRASGTTDADIGIGWVPSDRVIKKADW